uniref:Uncharacterized protein n=1 Tax=Anguilla anguilla TaxID=7936 RepID=A0A0E9QW85_ANGAN
MHLMQAAVLPTKKPFISR